VKPVPANRATQRDYKLAREAEHYGAKYATRIILECRAHDVAISDGFALIEQESEFKNIFGCDHNGGEGNPNMRYAQEVIARAHRWHRRFSQAGLA
jgi:hypothetical protein